MSLSNNLSSISPLSKGRWFKYLTGSNWKYVLRTLLIEKPKYLEHLQKLLSHDGSQMISSEISELNNLPGRFWMVEFSLPSLYTGNRTKLGEVIISCDAPIGANIDINDLVLAIRLPSLLLVKDSQKFLIPRPSSLHAHASIYNVYPNSVEW